MKNKSTCALLFAMVLATLTACGGSESGSGILSMDITDAKPLIPDNPTELWVTIDEVLAHRSGGGWLSLPLLETPLEINLLAFYGGRKTELVPPLELESGLYTQIRLVVSRASMVVDGRSYPIDLDIPSGKLRTDKQFSFEVVDGKAAAITIHFDMSQSIVVTGSNEYKLKPVIHLFDQEAREADTICGTVEPGNFVDNTVDVTIIWQGDKSDERYTQVTVTKQSETEATGFCVYWLVPGQDYVAEFDTDGDGTPEYSKPVTNLAPGEHRDLGTIPL